MKIKVCGITQEQDALTLDCLKVDYLGFIFYTQSQRFIEPQKAKSIIEKLKHAKAVGVFVDEKPQTINTIAHNLKLDLIQLHGFESKKVVAQINFPISKVVHIEHQKTPILPNYSVDYLLFDSKSKNEIGGTGVSFDSQILDSLQIKQPFFLAGGIGPHNLQKLLNLKPTPYAVDINSQVELSPGKKDFAKVKTCLKILQKHGKSDH